MRDFSTLLYETPADGVARIVMNRPEVRNAQNQAMTYELHQAFDLALHDDGIKVIILAATGPHFSSGHDLKPKRGKIGIDYAPRFNWGGFYEDAVGGRFAREQEVFLQATRRWRDLAKPTIAQVQGRCVAGGMMLVWACDLIVATEDASFCDPVVAMGVCGVEWFAHPFELGPRKAKELLWTGDTWSAEEAMSMGMVNKVVKRKELAEATLFMARKIAAKPAFAVRMSKQAVNKAVDLMGQQDTIDYAFGLHQLCHSHNLHEHGDGMDPAGLPPSLRK